MTVLMLFLKFQSFDVAYNSNIYNCNLLNMALYFNISTRNVHDITNNVKAIEILPLTKQLVVILLLGDTFVIKVLKPTDRRDARRRRRDHCNGEPKTGVTQAVNLCRLEYIARIYIHFEENFRQYLLILCSKCKIYLLAVSVNTYKNQGMLCLCSVHQC